MTSSFQLGAVQADGRREVVETHVDAQGRTHEARYLADAGTDYESVMQSRAIQIQARIDASESRDQIKAALDNALGAGTYDAVKAVCVPLGIELVELDSIAIDVRTDSPVTPDDADLAAAYAATGRSWVDLVNAVKALGISTVRLSFKRKITL